MRAHLSTLKVTNMCFYRAQCIVCDPKSPAMLPMHGNTIIKALQSTSSLPVSDKHEMPPLSLTIKGEGRGMALKVDPEDIALGVLSVGFLIRKEVCLMNQSDGVLQYEIQYTEGSTSHMVEKVSKRQLSQIRATSTSDIQNFEILADEPKGSIPAR